MHVHALYPAPVRTRRSRADLCTCAQVIDRILYKLDELVRPYVHKILVVIEPLLIDEDYYARVEVHYFPALPPTPPKVVSDGHVSAVVTSILLRAPSCLHGDGYKIYRHHNVLTTCLIGIMLH